MVDAAFDTKTRTESFTVGISGLVAMTYVWPATIALMEPNWSTDTMAGFTAAQFAAFRGRMLLAAFWIVTFGLLTSPTLARFTTPARAGSNAIVVGEFPT